MAYDLPEGYTREMLNQVEQQERELMPGITPLMDEPRESWRASNVSEDTIEDWFAIVLRIGPMWTVTEPDEPYGSILMKTFRMALGLHQIELGTAFSNTLLLQQNQSAKRERNMNLESDNLKHLNEQLRFARVRDRRDCDESIQALCDELKQLKDSFQQERKTRDEAARTLASQHQQRIENAGLALRRLKMNVGGLENDLTVKRAQTRTLTEQLGRLQETDFARSLEVGEIRRDKDALHQTVTEAAHSLQLLSTGHAELNGQFNALQDEHRLALQADAAARSFNKGLVAKNNRQLGHEKALITALATLQKQQEEDQDQTARRTAHKTELVRSRGLQDAQRQRLVVDHTAATAANQYNLDTLHDALLESTESFDTLQGAHVELQCNLNELKMDRTEIQQELRAVNTVLQKSWLRLERLEDQDEKLQRELGAVQTHVQQQNR
ncbi:hypothetical protein QFC21_006337 [Naganishia friedmannii]|uniref:Uncharacterized protein n=1 Tax=Naganishia friedmannii TaxID=89922 RepID=A0ACC2V3P0_9TREE|nr:hypothetical protein QFC21_006337 [Naganishia friedmannii]